MDGWEKLRALLRLRNLSLRTEGDGWRHRSVRANVWPHFHARTYGDVSQTRARTGPIKLDFQVFLPFSASYKHLMLHNSFIIYPVILIYL